MDSFLLKISKDGLEKLKGFYVTNLKSISKDTIEILLAKAGKKGGILISINPSCPRIYPLSNPLDADPVSEGAPKIIKKKLMRKRLREVRLPPFERVMEMVFDGGISLIHELLGRFSSLYLVEDGRIILSFGKKRKGLGATYEPPERGITPLDVTEENFHSSIKLLEGIPKDILESIKTYSDLRNILDLYNMGIHPRMGNVSLEELYLDQTLKEMEEKENELERERNKRIKKLKKTLKKLESEKKALEQRIKMKKHADILAMHLKDIKKGNRDFQAEDPETGETIIIKLDPSLSPSENLQALYQTYKKAKKGLKTLEERMLRIEEEIKREMERPIVVEEKPKSPTHQKIMQDMPVKKLKSPGGFTVYVGLNAKGNDMVRKLGSPNDLWFHLKDLKGPHAVMRVGKKTPGEEDIAFAASLVTGRRKGKLQVDYTELKYVKKPPGSPPGFVIYKNHRTVIIHGK